MAGISLYNIAVPTFTNGLKTLSHILAAAERFARENGLDADAAFANARLIEDQKPLVFQIQNATRTVRVNVDRLNDKESPPFIDTERTFADLHARIDAALELLKGVDVSVASSVEEKLVDVLAGGKALRLATRDAVLGHGVPNFIFHVTTAYAILRARGVPLGKADFICGFVGLEYED